MQIKALKFFRQLLFCNIFIYLSVFCSRGLEAADAYFYKNKFPGLTCVPLSFYLSTFFGSKEYEGFWDSVQGSNIEKKFEGFLKASNYFRVIDNDADEADVRLAVMFYSMSHDTPVEREQSLSLPVEFTVAGGGMSIRGLYELLNTLNPKLLNKFNLKHWDNRYLDHLEKWGKAHNDTVLSLETLKEKLSRSIKNGVPPVIGVTKKVWMNPGFFGDNPFEYVWVQKYSHALTLLHVDDEIDPETNSFDVEYIENEDGQRKKAYFYVHEKDSHVYLPHDFSMPSETIYFGEYEAKNQKSHLYELIEVLLSDTTNP